MGEQNCFKTRHNYNIHYIYGNVNNDLLTSYQQSDVNKIILKIPL